MIMAHEVGSFDAGMQVRCPYTLRFLSVCNMASWHMTHMDATADAPRVCPEGSGVCHKTKAPWDQHTDEKTERQRMRILSPRYETLW